MKFEKGATLFDLVKLSEYLENILGIPVDVVSQRVLHHMIKEDVLKERASL